MRSLVVAAAWLAATTLSHATPAPPAVRAEVDALIAKLVASGCGFNRNGTWYTAADAKGHLLRKLEVLEGRDLVQTTEQFIERGASGSSTSGKPYLVKCGATPPVESRAWLSTALKALRSGSR